MACLVDSAEPTSAPRAPMNSLKILTPSNGAPNDSRSLKLRKFGDFMEGRISQYRNIKRWDGAARTSTIWDSLRRVSPTSVCYECQEILSDIVRRVLL
jgi:hypothetical protein